MPRTVVCFFFFKQKTAYEMRISDWNSDVCSSDLTRARSCSRMIDERRALAPAAPSADTARTRGAIVELIARNCARTSLPSAVATTAASAAIAARVAWPTPIASVRAQARTMAELSFKKVRAWGGERGGKAG